MSDFRIVSDSSCDLPGEIIKKYDIDIVPFYVSFDGQTYYREGVDISNHEFYHKLIVEKKFSRTSLPSVQDYIDVFHRRLADGKDVLCFCISGKFSGSIQSAANAANILKDEFPDREIIIIDTLSISTGQGLQINQAAQLRSLGWDIHSVARE